MEAIKKEEMLLILGGVENAESCADVIADGNAHGPNDPDYNWDEWYKRFEEACL